MKRKIRIVLVLGIYLILGVFFLKYYQHQINADGISYISISQKYLTGDFSNAVNGYWGPLISWLLAPFLFFGLNPLLAAKVLSLIVGLATIMGIGLLSYRFEMTERIRCVILFSLIPIILYFSFAFITPDLLVVCILVYYLNNIFRADYPENMRNGIFCGAMGAIGYLSKAYVFFFFIFHFLLFNLFHYIQSTTKQKKNKVLRNFCLGLVMFFFISGIWINIISNKYNKITIGTSRRYNYAQKGPESKGDPVLCEGFFRPPNATAISAWEDPSYIDVKSWNPLKSRDSFVHQLKLILANTRMIIFQCELFSILSLVIILAYVLFCIRPFREIISQPNVVYPLATMLLYSAGYILVRVGTRYIWLVDVLLILMGGYSIDRLFRNDFFNDTRKKIVLIFFALTFIAMPLNQLIKDINAGKEIYDFSKALKEKYSVSGNVASNYEWGKTLYLSYHLGAKYYGQARKNISMGDLKRELKKYDIDYYFVWAGAPDEEKPGFGLQVYYLKGNQPKR